MTTPAQWLFGLLQANTYAPDDNDSSDIGLASLGHFADYAEAESVSITRNPAPNLYRPTVERQPTMARKPALGRITIGHNYTTGRDIVITNRLRAMLDYAEDLLGFGIRVSNGSFVPSSPSSGTTHANEAVDIGTRELSRAKRIATIRALKEAGFAVWYRPPNWDGKGGVEHAHALPIGGSLSPSAAWQIAQYDARRNALTSNAPDRTYRPDPVRFNYALGRPVPR